MSENTLKKCPVCIRGYRGMGALSRRDNQTEVCSDCGTREALEAFVGLSATNNPADPATTTCKHCGETVRHDGIGAWVDETDGDGCLQITKFNQVHEPVLEVAR